MTLHNDLIFQMLSDQLKRLYFHSTLYSLHTHFLSHKKTFYITSLFTIQKKRAPRESPSASASRHSHGESSPPQLSSSSSSSRPRQTLRLCDSCQATNPSTASVCEACGYFLAGSQQIPLTVAQSRGLVATPTPAVEALQAFEWESIEKGVASRQDAYCPICMEGFNRGYEVLLSCSHMYHRSCLQSFEKFMKTAERSCPICRTTNYQKKSQ